MFVISAGTALELQGGLANGGDFTACESADFTLKSGPAGQGAPPYFILRHGYDVFGVYLTGPAGPELAPAFCDGPAALVVAATSCGATLTCVEHDTPPHPMVVFSPAGDVAPARGCQPP